MPERSPHFLLFAEAYAPTRENAPGRWRFQLQSIDDGGHPLSVTANEPDLDQERLELLAVVRGLEALEQPSRVTLVTPSRYVGQGLRQHLPQWEESRWRWERFGRLEPIRDQDLWRRLARAAEIHQVECRMWRFDTRHSELDSDLPRSEHPPHIPRPHFKIRARHTATAAHPDRLGLGQGVLPDSHDSQAYERPLLREAVGA